MNDDSSQIISQSIDKWMKSIAIHLHLVDDLSKLIFVV